MTAPAPTADPYAAPLPAPFVVAVDDREKLAYRFAGLHADARQHCRPLVVETVTRHLPTGDYTIDGEGENELCPWAEMVAIERKSAEDLFCTLGQHRDRFERELERLAALDWAAVVVEAEWSELLRSPPIRSELNPKTVIRSVMAWQVRYPTLHWWFLPGRAVAEAVTYRLLEKFWREHQEKGG
jgi:ERCC4-type nuclease